MKNANEADNVGTPRQSIKEHIAPQGASPALQPLSRKALIGKGCDVGKIKSPGTKTGKTPQGLCGKHAATTTHIKELPPPLQRAMRENIIGKPLIVYWSYDAPTSHLEDSSVSVAHIQDVLFNFFGKTRWTRTFHLIHPYPLERE